MRAYLGLFALACASAHAGETIALMNVNCGHGIYVSCGPAVDSTGNISALADYNMSYGRLSTANISAVTFTQYDAQGNILHSFNSGPYGVVVGQYNYTCSPLSSQCFAGTETIGFIANDADNTVWLVGITGTFSQYWTSGGGSGRGGYAQHEHRLGVLVTITLTPQ